MCRSMLKKISIEPVVFLYVLAIFAEYDVIGDVFFVTKCVDHLNMTNLTNLHHCTEDLKHNKTDAISTAIAKQANKAQQIYNGILYATSILSSFLAATYADKRSKFCPIIIPIIGSAIVQILILGSLFHHSNDELPFLFTSRGASIIYLCSFVSGITGGTSTLLSLCFAHVADNCNQYRRTSRITIVEACLFGGGFFGFSLAGSILRAFPNSLHRYDLNFGMFLSVHIFLIIYLIMRRHIFHKPSGNHENQSRMGFKHLATSVFRTLNRRRLYKHQRFILYLILLAFIIISFWNVAITTMLFIYTRNMLHWPTYKYSYFSSCKFALCGIFLCLLPAIQYMLGPWGVSFRGLIRGPLSDGTIITIGLLSRASSIIFIGLASMIPKDYSTTVMVIALLTIIFAEYPIPALRSMLSKLVDPNEKAQMFAVLGALQSICFFIGGIGFLSIYNAVRDDLGPGWIFIFLGLMQLVSMLIFWFIQHLMTKSNMEEMAIARNSNDSNDLN